MASRDVIINLITRKKGDDVLKSLDKDLDGVGKKAEKTGGFFSALSSKLSGFGDNVGKDLTGKLGSAGDAIDDVGGGLGDLSGKAALAGGAIAGLGAFIAGGVGKLRELYDQTRNFNEVAGTTWEEGSRLIAVFDDLRVNADEGASAMGKLTKTVGESPEKLKEYGIEIVRAKDGTVDMVATLANVATAFQQTTDPAKRAALGSELFGKSWANMVPVLQRGGKELKSLIDGVDASQVATEAGAKKQDELFEATDNLNDAVAGLQRSLAENLVPALAAAAEGATEAVNAFAWLQDKVEELGPSFEESQEGSKWWKDMLPEIGKASDHVGISVGGFAAKLNQAAQAARDAQTFLEPLSGGLVNTELRAKEAAKAYSEFQKETRDLLQAQEEMRLALLATEDSTLGLEQAEIRAGDASFELSEKTRETTEAIKAHGENSTEAKIAVEEHRRAVADAQGAMNGAAAAAQQLAVDQAAMANTSLTAGQQVKVYRDELIKLRAGVADPALAAAMDAQIERLRAVAERAEDAASQVRGYNAALRDQAGIENNFVSRDSSGGAVVRRATGGPMWPGRSYLVHKDEVINWDGNGPADVLSPPEAARALSSGSVSTTGAPAGLRTAGDWVHGSKIAEVSSQGMGLAFPSLRSSPAGVRGGSSQVLGTRSVPGFELPASPYSGGGGSSGPNFYITINGYADLGKLISAIKQYEAARK